MRSHGADSRPVVVVIALAAFLAPAASQCSVKLCAVDNRTSTCSVSRLFANQLIGIFNDGVVGQIARLNAECQANCSETGCETDPTTGLCGVNRTFVARRLAAPVELGGAGFGERCGLFGQLMSAAVVCQEASTEEECSGIATAKNAEIPCAWDRIREICDVTKEGVSFLLRRDFRDELVRVALRRQQCAAKSLDTVCTGECRWVNQACHLNQQDALLAVAGEDCPLRTLMSLHEGCTTVLTADMCNDQLRRDGLPECFWRQGQCEAHPTSLEFDLMQLLGVGQQGALAQYREAYNRCSKSTSCEEECAGPIFGPSGTPRRAGVPLGSLAAALAFLVASHRVR